VCKIIFTYSVANDIHYVKDANQQIKFKNRIERKLKSIPPRLSKLARNFGKVAGVKPTTQNRTCAIKNQAIDINRPQGVEVDLREWLKGQWIRVVHIDETPAASRGRRENCAESIKNSIRNRVCSRTHTIVSSCVTSTPLADRAPQIFLPRRPRENRVITVRSLPIYSATCSPRSNAMVTVLWLVSPYIYAGLSLIVDFSLYLSLAYSLTYYYNYTISFN